MFGRLQGDEVESTPNNHGFSHQAAQNFPAMQPEQRRAPVESNPTNQQEI